MNKPTKEEPSLMLKTWDNIEEICLLQCRWCELQKPCEEGRKAIRSLIERHEDGGPKVTRKQIDNFIDELIFGDEEENKVAERFLRSIGVQVEEL